MAGKESLGDGGLAKKSGIVPLAEVAPRASPSSDFSESALAREELEVQGQRRGSLVRRVDAEEVVEYLDEDGRRQNEGDIDLYTEENVRRRLAARVSRKKRRVGVIMTGGVCCTCNPSCTCA